MMQSAAQQLLCLCACLCVQGTQIFFLQERLVFEKVKVLGLINISLAFRQVFLLCFFFGCKIKVAHFPAAAAAVHSVPICATLYRRNERILN